MPNAIKLKHTKMNKFIEEMLELGARSDKATSPVEIKMIINYAEYLYKNHISQLKAVINGLPANGNMSRSNQLDVAWKALECVGFERGNEFSDDYIYKMLQD